MTEPGETKPARKKKLRNNEQIVGSQEAFEKAVEEAARQAVKRQKTTGPDFSAILQAGYDIASMRKENQKVDKAVRSWQCGMRMEMLWKNEAKLERRPKIGSGEQIKRIKPSSGLNKYNRWIEKQCEADGRVKISVSKLKMKLPLMAGHEITAKVSAEVRTYLFLHSGLQTVADCSSRVLAPLLGTASGSRHHRKYESVNLINLSTMRSKIDET